MTTVNSFDDILDILDRNPDYQDALRQRILDEEHRQLPERIDRAVKAVADLAQTVADYVQRTNETLANHEERLERHEGQIAELTITGNRVLDTVANIQDRLGRVEGRMESMEGRMESMEGQMGSMEGRMGSMEGRMGSMEGQMGSMQGQMDSMQGQLNNLTGTDYERRIVRRSRSIAERYLGIRQAQLLQAITLPDKSDIPTMLYAAAEIGSISQEQADDVDDSDLILLGNTDDGSDSYALAEVSITIDDHDIDRAHRRAAILHAASGTPAKAAVIGVQISDANRQRADGLSVSVVLAAPRVRQ